MDTERTLGRRVTRRTLLGLLGGAGATLVIAACTTDTDDDDDSDAAAGQDDEDVDEAADEESEETVEDDDEEETETEVEQDEESDDEVTETEEEETAEEDEDTSAAEDVEAEIIVDDVIEFNLTPDGRWDGPFGWVTMRLHNGWVNGEDVTFVRTDASDEEFATQEGLVYVPLMANALDEPGSHGEIYLFNDGRHAQVPVLSSSPADGEAFSPAFRVHYVSGASELDSPLTSEQEILDAAEAGDVEVEDTEIIVNYPVVTWPGGQIPVDEEKTEYLGGGQLIEEPDIEGGQVTFKLQECYPDSRYIITDTSALPMAPMMGTGEAGGSQLLIEVGAVAPITVFANGLEGPGAMGFQPGIFNTSAGDPAWSPFWEHYTAEWVNEDEAVAVTSQQQLNDLVDDESLTLYGGVPDTDPETFVVNCSVPVRAPVTWEPSE